MANKAIISSPKIGMNTDSHPSQLTEQDYTFARNAVLENESGNAVNIKNEKSNLLTSKFKDGFKAINATNDIDTRDTYFFLVNPETGVGEFGVVRDNQVIPDLGDFEIEDCDECNTKIKLNEPLENQNQTESQQYITLISDECHVLNGEPEKGFNFNIKNPIKKTFIKNEKCGKTIYFDHIGNPPRYINLDNLAEYFIKENPCHEDDILTCADFNKMRVFKLFSIPELTPVSIQLGGSLRMGVYEFVVAYCNSDGMELSEYYSITTPVKVYDYNNRIQGQPDTSDRTSYSLKLRLDNLDTNYTHYKIVAIQTTDIENATRYFEVGVNTINNTEIIYDTEHNKKEISVDKIFEVRQKVVEAEGLAVANNILYHYGVTNKKELNLQPVVNILGELATRWQTHISTEDLYQDGVLASKYTTYSRDEVVPLGIKFKEKGGFVSATFPLVGRNPTEYDLEEINNVDRDSLEANSNDCNGSLRNKRWQIYNTATLEERCETVEDIEYVEVYEPTTRFCIRENIETIPAGSMDILDVDNFTSIDEYINTTLSTDISLRDCEEMFVGNTVDICSYLFADYSDINCLEDPFSDLDCDSPSVDYSVEVQSVINENVSDVYKKFPEDYSLRIAPKYCSPYETEMTSGAPIRDSEAEEALGLSLFKIYKRDSVPTNTTCQQAEDIMESSGAMGVSTFNTYAYSENFDDLITNKIGGKIEGQFQFENINNKALWFRLTTLNDSVILDLSIMKNATPDDFFSLFSQELRISIFKTCSQTEAIYSTVVDQSNGSSFLLEKEDRDLKITDLQGVEETILDGWGSNSTFFVVIETPLQYDNNNPNFLILATKGCYSVSKRDKEVAKKIVSWDSIYLQKKITLTATCTYQQPIVNSCQAFPFSKGNFAYHESTETYSDNSSLWDSSVLDISEEDVPKKYRELFTNSLGEFRNGKLVWNLDSDNKPIVDLTCRNIRHFKLPDNKVSPFMESVSSKQPFSSSLIFPIGFTINEEIINLLLDIALKNGLLTPKEREDIVGYEIVRGDISQDRSIVSAGLLYDMREYEDQGKKILYSNYPYNSYSDDKFNNISQPGFGLRNNSYTFHSPETDYFRPSLPTEMTIQGYSFGNASIYFDEVKKHPGWVIISSKARSLASKLATMEVVVETVIATASALSNSNLVGGTSTTVFPANIVGSAIIGAAMTAANIAQRYSKYRYEWQTAFTNMGSPQNFAYYQYGNGHYNNLQTLQNEGNMVRGLNVAKYLKDGRFTTTNEVTGQRISINNEIREYSVFLNIGDFNLNYSPAYYNYDRNNFNSSMTYLGENNISSSGKSPEIVRNIASPYVHLKQYLPNQYGSINNIKWLTSGYHGDLRAPRTDCLPIFGGDTLIVRHSLKRKHAQFLVDAMGLADRTPFNYYFYNNIGKTPRFYASVGVDKDFENGGKVFPSVENDVAFDNNTSSGFYIKTPSKFYMYHYGIPSFLCETRIDTTKRYGEKDYHRQFDEIVDIADWTQETNVGIRERNWFFYNKAYSKQSTQFKSRMLQPNFNKESNDCRTDFPNGIISSMPDNSENNTYDPWLIYRGADFFEFRTDYGKLRDVVGIENEAVLARFDNTSIVFNKVDYTNDDGQNPSSNFLGGTSVFQRRTASFVNSQLGYGGSQNVASVSNEFGHFHADAMRGQVINIPPGGGAMTEISSQINGKPSGKRQWFKEHLPFKILKYFKNVDTDNNYNGIGLSFGWDSRFRRVLLTKKDYIPKSSDIKYDGADFYIPQEPTTEITCKDGYTYDPITNLCVKKEIVQEIIEYPEQVIHHPEEIITTTEKIEGCVNYDKYTFHFQYDDSAGGGQSVETFYWTLCDGTVKQVDIPVQGSGVESYTISGCILDPPATRYEPDFAISEDQSCTFITKEEVIPAWTEIIPGYTETIEKEEIYYDDPIIIKDDGKYIISLTDPDYFEDVSWTIAYSPILGGWISYYDFKPNYYVNHNTYFQTGLNQTNDYNEFGLWSHGLTNKSYNVFYGKKYPFEVESVVKAESDVKRLESIKVWTEAKRYHNDYDFAVNPKITFNESIIYNNIECSGKLNLIPQMNNFVGNSKYPITNNNNTQDILISNLDNFKWSYNYFYNRVKTNVNNYPIMSFDKNQIGRDINSSIVSFNGKKLLERLDGQWFLNKLKFDKDSRYSLTFKFLINELDV